MAGETALHRRRRLARELARIRHTENTQGVNPETGKRMKVSRKKELMTTDAATDIVLTPGEGASGAWADVEAGSYDATITGFTDAGVSTVYPKDGPRVRLELTLDGMLDDEGNPIVMYRYDSQKMTTGAMTSNLWKWAEAAGIPPQKGVGFKMSNFLGCKVQAVVNVEKKADGTSRPKVTALLPPRKNRSGLAASVRAEQPENVNQDIGGCIVCDEPGTAFSPKGKPLCEAHKHVG